MLIVIGGTRKNINNLTVYFEIILMVVDGRIPPFVDQFLKEAYRNGLHSIWPKTIKKHPCLVTNIISK